jgi:type II secretory pathway pseudopilin PulG
MYKINRRFVTLIEMMIVMFLIALITGVIAYNYRGSLDEGKAFKTNAGIEKLETILNLEASKSPNAAGQIVSEWQAFVRASPIVHDANSLIKDGWGQDYEVILDPDTGAIRVRSAKLEEYRRTHNTLFRE